MIISQPGPRQSVSHRKDSRHTVCKDSLLLSVDEWCCWSDRSALRGRLGHESVTARKRQRKKNKGDFAGLMCDRKSSRRHAGKRESSSRASESGLRSADGATPEVPIVIPDGKEFRESMCRGFVYYLQLHVAMAAKPLTSGEKKSWKWCWFDSQALNYCCRNARFSSQTSYKLWHEKLHLWLVLLRNESWATFTESFSPFWPICCSCSLVGATTLSTCLCELWSSLFLLRCSCWLSPFLLLLELLVFWDLAGNHMR